MLAFEAVRLKRGAGASPDSVIAPIFIGNNNCLDFVVHIRACERVDLVLAIFILAMI